MGIYFNNQHDDTNNTSLTCSTNIDKIQLTKPYQLLKLQKYTNLLKKIIGTSLLYQGGNDIYKKIYFITPTKNKSSFFIVYTNTSKKNNLLIVGYFYKITAHS